MKRGKSNILLIITVILIALIALFMILKNFPLTSKVIEKPPVVDSNCSNQSIKAAWEAIFQGSSENLIIIAPFNQSLNETNSSELGLFTIGSCPVYSVYQTNGSNMKILLGIDIWFFMDMKMIMAVNGEFTPSAIEDLKNLSLDEDNMELMNIGGSSFLSEEFIKNNSLSRNISTPEQAKSQFESVFKRSSSNWTINITEEQNLTFYSFDENETLENMTLFGESIDPIGMKGKAGLIFKDNSLDAYIYSEVSMFGLLESLIKEYENWTSPINTSLNNITIYVNGSKLDILGDYTEKQRVEIHQNNQKIIEADLNFTEEFDWTNIILKKQDSSSIKGYVIVNGLNYTKNITVDRLNNKSESVCIKDSEVNNINEISLGCNSTNEYILDCPGQIGNFTCNIYGNKFIITGLTHSAVLEIIPEEEPCIPNWECDDWTDYEDSCGYRTCADLNDCNNISGRPIEQKECPICIPNWDCTEFSPEKCPKTEVRTRTCTDLNDCGTLQERPDLKETCERKINWIWILIGVVGAIIILVIILLITRKNQGNMQPNQNNYQNNPRYPPDIQQQNYSQYPNDSSDLEQGYNQNQILVPRTQPGPNVQMNSQQNY